MYARTTRGYGLAIFFCLSAHGALAADGSFSLGIGADYSSGDYGTGVETRMFSVPVTAQYDTGPWSLRLIVPYLRVSGGTAIPGIGSVPNANARGTAGTPETASGLGDIVAAAIYNLYYDSASRTGIDVTGKIKFGTADADKGLGTGKEDVSAQVDAYRSFERYTVFGGIGYTIYGSSSFLELDDAFNIALGGSYRLDNRDSVGLRLDARDPIGANLSEQRELMAYWVRKIDRIWKFQAYVLRGFADGSPDWGVGAAMAYAF